MADKLDVYLAVCCDALRAEEEVKNRLSGGAEKYLAVIGLLVGFHLVEHQELSFSGGASHIACTVAAVLGWVLLFAALALVLWAMRVRDYPTYPQSSEMKRVAASATEDAAKILAANVYLDLRDGILAVNEKRASTMRIAGIVLLAGFLMSVLGQLGLGIKF
jgi:hypothetical protein